MIMGQKTLGLSKFLTTSIQIYIDYEAQLNKVELMNYAKNIFTSFSNFDGGCSFFQIYYGKG